MPQPLTDHSLDVFDADGLQQVFAISPFGNSETREERLARWVVLGAYDPACAMCAKVAAHPTLSPFQPSHKPSGGCGSGKRPHCSCPRCWG